MTDGQTIAHNVAGGIRVLATIASVESRIMPYAVMIGGLFPGVASILGAIQVAQPWIDKAVAAAPAIEAGIEAGAPIIDAINGAGPQVLTHIKTAYAVLANADPSVDEQYDSPNDVSDVAAIKFAGPAVLGREWTQEETQRWFDKADGAMRDSAGGRAGSW